MDNQEQTEPNFPNEERKWDPSIGGYVIIDETGDRRPEKEVLEADNLERAPDEVNETSLENSPLHQRISGLLSQD